MSVAEENIKVVVRIRPLQTNEKKNGDISCVQSIANGKEVQVKVGPLDAQVYRCNQCFTIDTTQLTFFNESGITELLDLAMQGYRACAFAFGQTGAGKTFTMIGPSKSINHREKQMGLISRSLEYLFNKLKPLKTRFKIRLSCLEIYHEQVFDLFADEKERVSLSVREHATDGFYLEGCKLVDCADFEIACAALGLAFRNRQVGGHDLNNRSSRSHCLTEIFIELPATTTSAPQVIGDGSPAKEDLDLTADFITRGKMSLVDLAGSERLKSTNSTGKVLQEAGFINRSLYVLGKVIAGLVRTGGDLNHKDVPFRDSKLTKLLISSLAGNCRTLLVSCITEAKGSQAETLRTLKFSMSCARIRNKPVKFLDPQQKLIMDLRTEIMRLRHENKQLRSTVVTAPSSGEHLGEVNSPGAGSLHGVHLYRQTNSAQDHGSEYSVVSDHRSVKLNAQKRNGKKMRASQSDFIRGMPRRISPLKHATKVRKKNVRTGLVKDKGLTKGPLSPQKFPRRGPRADPLEFCPLQEEEGEDGSVTSSSSRRIPQKEMDELIHRQATGPMVFKRGSGDIVPVRDSGIAQLGPAQTLMKSYEALAESGKPLGSVVSPVKSYHVRGLKGGQAMGKGPHGLVKVSSKAEGGEVKKKISRGYKIEGADKWQKRHKKQSPYLDHLKDEPMKSRKPREEPLVAKPSRKNSLSSAADRAAKQAQVVGTQGIALSRRNSLDEADSPDPNVVTPAAAAMEAAIAAAVEARKSGREVDIEGTMSAAAAEEQRKQSQGNRDKDKQPSLKRKQSEDSNKKNLHQAIADELAELGLGFDPPTDSTTKDGKGKAKGILPQLAKGQPQTGEDSSKAKGSGATGSKLPKIDQTSPSSSGSGSGKSKVAALRKEVSDNNSLSTAQSVPTLARASSQTGGGTKSVNQIRAKLAKLELSLAESKIEMEDYPGEVTAEAEEHFAAMQREAKMIRQELRMHGVELDPDKDGGSFRLDLAAQHADDDSYEDGAPTPAAVRNAALSLQEANDASVSASIPAPTVTAQEGEDSYGEEDFEDDFEHDDDGEEEKASSNNKPVSNQEDSKDASKEEQDLEGAVEPQPVLNQQNDSIPSPVVLNEARSSDEVLFLSPKTSSVVENKSGSEESPVASAPVTAVSEKKEPAADAHEEDDGYESEFEDLEDHEHDVPLNAAVTKNTVDIIKAESAKKESSSKQENTDVTLAIQSTKVSADQNHTTVSKIVQQDNKDEKKENDENEDALFDDFDLIDAEVAAESIPIAEQESKEKSEETKAVEEKQASVQVAKSAEASIKKQGSVGTKEKENEAATSTSVPLKPSYTSKSDASLLDFPSFRSELEEDNPVLASQPAEKATTDSTKITVPAPEKVPTTATAPKAAPMTKAGSKKSDVFSADDDYGDDDFDDYEHSFEL